MSRKILHAGKFISRGKGRHATRIMESHELIAVLSGELNMFEEERYFRIRSGEYLILQRGRKHGGLVNYPANLSFFWIHFLDDDIVAELPQSGKLSEHSPLPSYAQMYLLEQSRAEPDRESLSLLFELMIREIRRSSEIASETVTTPLADAARRYLLMHSAEQISLRSISSELHCNPKYLGQIYRRIYGETLIATLNRLRIDLACQLLVTDGASIKETAQNCGFNDMAYFRRQFVKHCAMTPGEFVYQKRKGFLNSDHGTKINISSPDQQHREQDKK